MNLINLDTSLLVRINNLHTSFLDVWMWNISSQWVWVPLYAVLIYCLLRRFGKQSIWIVLALAVAVGLADFISSGIIKPLVCRPRPTHTPLIEDMLLVVNGYRGGQYGFVSSHAANTFSIALLFCLIWQHSSPHRQKAASWTWVLMLWCGLNCYSRMYLGVHYPGDILGGLLVGGIVAGLIYTILRQLNQRSVISLTSPYDNTSIQQKTLNLLPLATLLLTLIACCFPIA